MQVKKVVSPRSDSSSDTLCKVKCLEQFQCKVVAFGSGSEVKSVMTNMEMPMMEEKLVLNQPRRPVKAKRIVQKRMAMQMNLPPKGEHGLKQQRKTVKVNEAHRRAASS